MYRFIYIQINLFIIAKNYSMTEISSITKTEIKFHLKEHVDQMKINVCKMLQKKKMTKAELGRRMDRDADYVNYLINHPSPNPTLGTIVTLAKVLGTDIHSLFKK